MQTGHPVCKRRGGWRRVQVAGRPAEPALAGGGKVWAELGKRLGLIKLVDKVKLVWFKLTF